MPETDMGGGCSCSFDDYDSPDFWRETFHVARKQWKCIECGKPILPGQRYQYIVGKWDGLVDQCRTCLPCAGMRRDLAPCACYGELEYELREMYQIDLLGEVWFSDITCEWYDSIEEMEVAEAEEEEHGKA